MSVIDKLSRTPATGRRAVDLSVEAVFVTQQAGGLDDCGEFHLGNPG